MKHDTRTLVILSPGFPKDEADTSCLPAHQAFVRALNKNFPSLQIIIFSFQYPFSTTAYDWYGNKVIPFNGLKTGKGARLILWLRMWRKLHELKKSNNVVGLLSFWLSECALVGKYFGKWNKLKHFGWITGQDATKGNKYIPFIRPKPGELIAMSDFLSDIFYTNYHIRPLYIIPNGIEPSLFPERGVERPVTILGAGSLIPLKQYEIFVNVAAEIIREMPGSTAILCGKGPQEKQLRQLIEQLQLQDHIVLTGEKPHTEILQVMQRTKVFLHTSAYEGFSTVCLEALFAGGHVISFIKPMHHDIDNWHIVQTPEEMIKKALEILKDPATAYTSVSPYTMDDCSRLVMLLFDYNELTTS